MSGNYSVTDDVLLASHFPNMSADENCTARGC